MTDLHQGVTPATHDVLDLLDKNAETWGDQQTLGAQLRDALAGCDAAHGGFITNRSLVDLRAHAVEAAARLLDAINEIDRCIAAGEV